MSYLLSAIHLHSLVFRGPYDVALIVCLILMLVLTYYVSMPFRILTVIVDVILILVILGVL